MTAITREQQIRGQKQVITTATINPIGGGLIMGPLVSLLALFYGASDFSMGLIYAAIYITSIGALIPPLFLNRVDFTNILGYAWLLRSFCGGGLLLLPFIDDNQTKVTVLIILLYGFMILRSTGAAAASPIFKTLNRSNELTSFIAKIWSRWYFGVLITTIVSYIVLENKDLFGNEEYAYMFLLFIALIFNVITSLKYLKIPKTGTLDGRGIVSLARAFHYVRSRADNRDVIYVGFLQVALAIAAAYQLSHIKGPLEFSPGSVFALTLAGVVGAFAMASLVSLLGDRVSFRALLFITHALLAVCGLGWLLIQYLPTDTQDILASLLYIGATTMLALSATVLSAMSNARLPDNLRLEVNIIFLLNVTLSAVCALGLIALLRWLCGDYFTNPYTFAYIPWVLLCIGICIWAVVRRSNSDPEILSELLQLKPSNIQSMYVTQRVSQEKAEYSRHRVRQIENALLTDTPATRESLLKFLQSNHMTDRLAAYYSLFERPYKKAYPIVRKEALDPFSPIRHEAITALGLSQDEENIETLNQLLEEENERLVSSAIKSLLRLNAPIDYDKVLEHYKKTDDYRQRHEIVIGLSENKQQELLKTILIEEGQGETDRRWLTTLSLQWADTLNRQQSMAMFLQLENEGDGEGVDDVLREMANVYPDIWQERLENWSAHKDPDKFITSYPQIKLWPVRHSLDMLLQLLIYIWSQEGDPQ